MIINHVYIGRGPVKASDLFNILTWASIGATVNIYVAHPDKQPIAEQHTYESLFNLSQALGGGISMNYPGGRLFSMYSFVDGVARGLADRVNLINLHNTLGNHDVDVPQSLQLPTLGWKTGILKFLAATGDWWPNGGGMNDAVIEKLFTVVDATKFYLAATKEGLVCDMKVAPTKYFWAHRATIDAKFISYQRGNAAAVGYENQLSGSMCASNAAPRQGYADKGKAAGDGFGAKTVAEAARYFEKITAAHGSAMVWLVQRTLGADSTKLDRKVVMDLERGWTGPVCVFKHPKDQSWRGMTVTGDMKARAKQDIDAMTKESLKLVKTAGTLGPHVFEAMVAISEFPGFNIYA